MLENRLVAVGIQTTAKYYYDGNGARVMAVEGGTTTVYMGAHFEWRGSTSTMKKHNELIEFAFAGSQHLAVPTGVKRLFVFPISGLLQAASRYAPKNTAPVDVRVTSRTWTRRRRRCGVSRASVASEYRLRLWRGFLSVRFT